MGLRRYKIRFCGCLHSSTRLTQFTFAFGTLFLKISTYVCHQKRISYIYYLDGSQREVTLVCEDKELLVCKTKK